MSASGKVPRYSIRRYPDGPAGSRYRVIDNGDNQRPVTGWLSRADAKAEAKALNQF